MVTKFVNNNLHVLFFIKPIDQIFGIKTNAITTPSQNPVRQK